ncbi:MAG: hypothetical protein EO766_02895 [Hydrotalea sp. AMD]|uniref:hypothetical protein n=1 Tax=Hydrotalea sp. AMD TaxID=2501297 RepID=UPI000945162F|nr:hypothetical protein [Hydrotalea sp. AMD]RWZ90368.1 MAG: hypothetical protein EO766_02895 [Hydrotalea sp. AMD]
MNTYHFLTYIFIGISLTAILTSCSSKSEKQNNDYYTSSYDNRNYESNSSNYSEEEESNEDNDEYSSNSGCKFEDGTYSATVNYYNPETGYSQTYTLDVEVEDCEVVQIDFPNGGWLDIDHITPAKL